MASLPHSPSSSTRAQELSASVHVEPASQQIEVSLTKLVFFFEKNLMGVCRRVKSLKLILIKEKKKKKLVRRVLFDIHLVL